MLEICVRISYLGIQNRLVYGVGVIRVFLLLWIYSDYLSEFRFYEVLGIFKKLYGLGSWEKF